MDRKLGAATLLSLAAALVVPLAPALAQSAQGPGSTISGTVPTTEGNVWGGLDHQPTPADVPPSTAQQQAKINHKLDKLDQQLLNFQLPKLPAGAPSVSGN
jgi:hypothetical protein